jgi:hypothetical protein
MSGAGFPGKLRAMDAVLIVAGVLIIVAMFALLAFVTVAITQAVRRR